MVNENGAERHPCSMYIFGMIRLAFHYASLTLYFIDTHFDASAFENIVGKGEIARNEQFLLFPQCFLHNQIIVSPSVHIVDIISKFAPELEDSKIGI